MAPHAHSNEFSHYQSFGKNVILKKGFNLLRDFFIYFRKGWEAKLLQHYLKVFISSFLFHLNKFRHSLNENEFFHIKEAQIKKLQTASLGLYSLLPSNPLFSYSILIAVSNPKPAFFQISLESIFNQSPPSIEILIGFTQPPLEPIKKLISDFSHHHPTKKLRVLNDSKRMGKQETINKLADMAEGNFLFLMEEEDWLRPDLFFRYEQTLRIFPSPENRVLFCDLKQLSDNNAVFPSNHPQPSSFNFPFVFKRFEIKGLLIPKALWGKINSSQLIESQGAENEDLILQLDLKEAIFQHIPLPLYFFRSLHKEEKLKSEKTFLKVVERYTQAKHLNWEWSSGYQPFTARAVPSLTQDHSIQVIIPYKDHKEMTMNCVNSLLKQEGVQFKITAIDNGSHDTSIGEAISSLGEEVIRVDEPFNYSRLNNLAVKQTQLAASCDILLFLNNDVELEPRALLEMLRWIDQPQIGIVGCRLNYPDGRLQHGGVFLDSDRKKMMRWEHIEKFRTFEELNLTKTLGIFDAVTSACAMTQRKTFLDVGGFDEIWYPIGYSDTNFALKVRAKGLKCFYTPYAVGTHHESLSRKTSIEDFENSWWLHEVLATKSVYQENFPQEKTFV